ncbi:MULTISPECIES: hypothetical protein [unclassified Leucobacter]|nr:MULTISPECIES: hypothetical protein [unclassified Leucobacter]MBC9927407.1 hypothetical protein [Leucobacter sp. cx-169]
MIPPHNFDEAMDRAVEELAHAGSRGIDAALEAMWWVVKSYEDDDFSTE